MTDPIHGVNLSDALGAAASAQSGSPPRTESDRPSDLANPVDSADIARAEALLAAITQAAAAVPPLDQSRVAELRQAVNSGVYQASPEQIAATIIEIEGLLAASGNSG